MFNRRQDPNRRAFALGTMFFIVFAALIGGFAFARGPELFLPFAPAATSFEPSPGATPEKSSVPQPSSAHSRGRPSAGGAVCVRLCDGFFFPAADPAGGDASCQAQCPDASVSLYWRPADDINDAVSLSGAKYTDLPIADRYQTTFDNTCACRRNGNLNYRATLAKDRTLRAGDIVMTANGFVVVQTNKVTGSLSFVALGQATSLTKDLRAELTAMEQPGRPAATVDARLTVTLEKSRHIPDPP